MIRSLFSSRSPRPTPSPPAIRAEVGPRFGKDGRRQRSIGRILSGGTALPQLAADWDCCTLDGQAIRDERGWISIIQSGRLAEVLGAFALVWQEPDGTLTLARDGVGERTLFYACTPGGVVFGSSLPEMLATGLVPHVLNLSAVATYLAYAYLPGRETLVRDVYEVLPGELVRLRAGQVERGPFWRLPAERSDFAEEELRRTLRGLLEDAVRCRLPAGEPVGSFLSGGLDSSLVTALACRHHDAPVYTYSISFGDGYANELPFSSMVAEHCRTLHRIVELSPPVILHHLDDTIRLLSDPIGDPLTVPNALLFREAAREVGAVLNGEGGDPCFGGPKNLPMLLSELYDGGDSYRRERSYLRAHLKCYDDLPVMLTPAVRDALAEQPLERWLSEYFDDPRWRQFVTKLQGLNITFKGGHHILPKVDALSCVFGVLPRSPLFDRRLAELSLAIPPQLKLRGSVEKYLLKEAVADLLPRAILDRPKSGMLVPVEAWFQGPLRVQARERLLDGLMPFGLIERPYLERLLSGRLGGTRPRHGAKIWLLVTLEAWLRTVFRA